MHAEDAQTRQMVVEGIGEIKDNLHDVANSMPQWAARNNATAWAITECRCRDTPLGSIPRGNLTTAAMTSARPHADVPLAYTLNGRGAVTVSAPAREARDEERGALASSGDAGAQRQGCGRR